jgi:predicted SAM-dependent methyltransferase
MKINLGCGNQKEEGFVNLDMDPSVNPDIVYDIQDILPFDDGTVSEVRAYHIFEHIGDKFFDLMCEIYRVCCNGAIVDVRVPHHRHDYFFGDPSHVRPITIENMKRFSKNMDSDLQSFGTLLDIDFEMVWHHYVLEPYFEEQFRTLSEDQCNMMARIYNNVIQEIHFRMRVNK